MALSPTLRPRVSHTRLAIKLPNAANAYVDLAKLHDYCLNPEHPRGQHKARVFAQALGLTAVHAEELRQNLLDAVRSSDATFLERV